MGINVLFDLICYLASFFGDHAVKGNPASRRAYGWALVNYSNHLYEDRFPSDLFKLLGFLSILQGFKRIPGTTLPWYLKRPVYGPQLLATGAAI